MVAAVPGGDKDSRWRNDVRVAAETAATTSNHHFPFVIASPAQPGVAIHLLS